MPINIKKSGRILESEGRCEINTTCIIPLIGEKVTLLPHHLEELIRSGIDDRIIALNFFSIQGDAVTDFLNLSDVPGFGFKYGSVIFHGGWKCRTVFKPDKPREIKRKPIKYEMPVGCDPSPIKLEMPEEIWQAIATKYKVPKPSDLDGWTWVEQNPQVTIAACEGVKKAACVITQTLTPTLAFPGHTVAFQKDGDVRFTEFLHTDRKIILCFDEDISDITAASVAGSVRGVGYRLNPIDKDKPKKKRQLTRAQLFICRWLHPEKGIDDVWLKHGQAEVTRILTESIPWREWVDMSFNKLGFEPDHTFNSNQWQWTDIPEDVYFICLNGAMGTGKSWCLEQITLRAKESKRPVITATHRIQISMSLAGRLQIKFISEIDGKIDTILQLALVIDSLPKIDPIKFKGCIFILDEVRKMLDHFLLGETCAYKRQAILNTMRELCIQIVNSGGKLIIADADLNGTTIRFFSGLLGDEKPFIIQNTYREISYTCHLSNGFIATTASGKKVISPADIVATALSKAIKGKRIYISCTGQREESTWGSITLEGLFLAYGITSVIRIDSESIKNPEHPAFKAVNKINEICDKYQVIIATPTLNVGVDIKNKIPFDLICGIFTGVGTPDEARQALMRVRDKGVPRLIYCATRGLDKNLLSLGTTENTVSSKVQELTEFQQEVLTEHDQIWCAEYPDIRYNQSASNCFKEIVAAKNKQTLAYKNYVRQGLKDENVTLIDVTDAREVYGDITINPQEVYDLTKTITLEKVEDYRAKIIKQGRLEAEEYEKLKSATELSDAERLALEATAISNKYGGVKVTEELLEKDSAGWYDQIRLHYAATKGYERMKNIQALVSNTQLHRGEGELIEHDFMGRNKILAQAEHIRATEIIDLIDGEYEFSAIDEESVLLYNDLVEQVPTINLIHEQNLKSSSFKSGEFNFKLIELVGSLVGVKSDCLGKPRINGKRVRKYALSFPSDHRQEIFELWENRDTEIEKKWFKRRKDWEIKQLVGQITADISISKLENLRQLELFESAWEYVYTSDRIQIVNKVDNYNLITPEIKLIKPQTTAYIVALADFATWTKFAVDLETFGTDAKNKEGLHARRGRIRLIQISNGEKVYIVDLGSRISDREQIQRDHSAFLQILENKITDPFVLTVNHNIHFDLRFLRFQLGFETVQNICDTMKGLQIFFGDYGGLGVLPGGYGLGNACEKLLGIKVDKSEQKSDWGSDSLTESQMIYAAYDPYYTYHLYDRIEELYSNPVKFGFGKLAQEGIRDAWQLENDIIPSAIELEANGLPFNQDVAQANLDKCLTIQANLLMEWDKLLTQEGSDKPELKHTQGQKLKGFLNQKYSLNITKLDKAAIANLKEYPEVQLLTKLRAITVPINQLQAFIRSAEETGRVQTTFKTLTGTGRFSSGDSKTFKDLPNLQSISAKANPTLKEFELQGVRTCITTDGLGAFKYYVLDKKSAQKQIKNYEKLALNAPEHKEYIEKCLAYLTKIVSIEIDIVPCETINLDWVDDKAFTKLFKDSNPQLKTIARKVTDRALVVVDLAGSHGRIAADISNELTAAAGFNDDSIDNHSKVAVSVAEALKQQITWEEIAKNKKDAPYKMYRDTAKNTFYGWINGAGANRIQEQIQGNSGEAVSLDACKGALKGCDTLFPAFIEWRNELTKTISDEDTLLSIDGKKYAINKISSVNNRIIHLMKATPNGLELPFTKALAAIWSRTEATVLKRALIKIIEAGKANPQWEIKTINYVHDEINVEGNALYIKEIATTVNNIIGNCFAEILTIVSDGRETNWAKLVVNNWSEK